MSPAPRIPRFGVPSRPGPGRWPVRPAALLARASVAPAAQVRPPAPRVPFFAARLAIVGLPEAAKGPEGPGLGPGCGIVKSPWIRAVAPRVPRVPVFRHISHMRARARVRVSREIKLFSKKPGPSGPGNDFNGLNWDPGRDPIGTLGARC